MRPDLPRLGRRLFLKVLNPRGFLIIEKWSPVCPYGHATGFRDRIGFVIASDLQAGTE